MQTLSSARRTCMASASAVECTATVWMPSSFAARSTRKAISPRLAMRILWNIVMPLFDHDKRLAVFDRLGVLEQDRRHRSGAWRWNLVHRLHRLDDEQRLALAHFLANRDERLGIGRGGHVGGADHRRGHRVLGDVDRRLLPL